MSAAHIDVGGRMYASRTIPQQMRAGSSTRLTWTNFYTAAVGLPVDVSTVTRTSPVPVVLCMGVIGFGPIVVQRTGQKDTDDIVLQR